MATVFPTHERIRRHGRWTPSSGPSSQSLTVSWAGASLILIVSSAAAYLRVRVGPHTQRKDSDNGGVPMLVCTITTSLAANAHPTTRTDTYVDVQPGELALFAEPEGNADGEGERTVELTMVDWASQFEIEAILVPSEADLLPLSPIYPGRASMLVIGDSIACAASDGSKPMPLGSLDSFAAVVARELSLSLSLVAYPGLTLVDPTPEEIEKHGTGLSMAKRYFHTSPWADTPAPLDEAPSIIVVELGSNDVDLPVAPERYTAAMYAFVLRLAEVYAATLKHVCILAPFPSFLDEEPWYALGEQTAPGIVAGLQKEFGERVLVNAWDISRVLRADLVMDGVHPTREGHKVVGEKLARELAKVLG
ncbi:hypothetical protein BV25DRAFT_1830696 [Artomyces pyxidatus]|uniref:Uncharacterized protein n=1 Tax=Artomyces pyxidatus TaxID=48021 RepID=A0ACB8SNE3_9AGAM|nr:hypothetical protein BV25DRAFT_1830696 [Artomyces pyxidatus]